jgi:hypothetical protein
MILSWGCSRPVNTSKLAGLPEYGCTFTPHFAGSNLKHSKALNYPLQERTPLVNKATFSLLKGWPYKKGDYCSFFLTKNDFITLKFAINNLLGGIQLLPEIINCMPDGLVKIYIGYWQTCQYLRIYLYSYMLYVV